MMEEFATALGATFGVIVFSATFMPIMFGIATIVNRRA